MPRLGVQKIGSEWGVVLQGSPTVKRFGHKGLVVIKTCTIDSAIDWISRLKSIKGRRKMRLFLIKNGSFV